MSIWLPKSASIEPRKDYLESREKLLEGGLQQGERLRGRSGSMTATSDTETEAKNLETAVNGARDASASAEINAAFSNSKLSVLGCIDADFGNQIVILQHFSRSARFKHFCTARDFKF